MLMPKRPPSHYFAEREGRLCISNVKKEKLAHKGEKGREGKRCTLPSNKSDK